MNIKEFNTLTKSEIKKVNKAGNGKVGEYYTEPSEVPGFVDVTCSVFDNEFNSIIATVKLIVCLWDRRRSWVAFVKEA
jgi:hypothetical protein